VSFSSPFEVLTELSHAVRARALGELLDIDFLISRFGLQIYFHFVWCTIFGLFFAKVYNLIPGKGVIKGLFYGLIGLIITEGRVIGYSIVQVFYFKAFGLNDVAQFIKFEAEQMGLLGLTVWIVFGFVLGLLYRKPTEAQTVEKEDIQTLRMVKCIHCNASINKGSKFCNACGKQQ
jgi:hypothetical protein